MARILIVEDDGLVARQMAQALRGAGHASLLAPDAQAALREAGSRPALILLDLGLPDLPGETLLGALRQVPETAAAPIVVITGKPDRAERLHRERPGDVAAVLWKPVADARLCQAVRTALRPPPRARLAQPAPAPAEFHRRELIRRLIVEGPDRLAFHIYRRVCADRTGVARPESAEVHTWREIAHWAGLEGLLSEAEALLLCGDTDLPRSRGCPDS